MKEYPILFSGPMINEIRAKRKFVTRRLSKQWLKVKAGDRLWVRETWTGTWCYEEMGLVYAADGAARRIEIPEVPHDYCLPKVAMKLGAWVSPLFMPRWASRILLECEEDARPQRLQDITEEEAIAEGVDVWSDSANPARWKFLCLWDDLYTKPGETWSENPTIVRVGRFHIVKP